MYAVGLSKDFTAWHVMPGMEGPEGVLHSHEYRLDVVMSVDELDEHGMVCDLDILSAVMDDVVGAVADKNLETIRPTDADAVTVEVFARWAHGKMAERLTVSGDLAVRLWESPVAFGGYTAPIRSS